ncbi:MAG: hypothetical protein IH626_02695 [Rhodospirillales bacterium]|nr:hypothetical protein [Rhodospirillales bacterium]
MTKMIPLLAAVLVTATLGLSPARAAEDTPLSNRAEQAEKALREGAEKMIRALQGLIQSIPQYEAPKVLDNGDIILRRKDPGTPEPDEPKRTPPADDHTST